MTTSLAALALAALIVCAAPASACSLPGNAAELQAEVLKRVNAERKANGLAALQLSQKLDKAAQGHACDNAARQTTSHTSSDGGSLKTRLREVGYSFRAAAENTGRGFGSAKTAVEFWMASSGHRANILLRKGRDVGLGIAVSDAPDSKLHWVLVIGAGR